MGYRSGSNTVSKIALSTAHDITRTCLLRGDSSQCSATVDPQVAGPVFNELRIIPSDGRSPDSKNVALLPKESDLGVCWILLHMTWDAQTDS